MKLTDSQKLDHANMENLWNITQACYSGAELPERPFFENVVRDGDVWVTKWGTGYALASRDYLANTPLLRSVAVMANHRGLGHAGSLLKEMHAFYRELGMQRILLHCKQSNPAQKLYFDVGYRVTAVLKNYYAPEGDGLEMEKKLCV